MKNAVTTETLKNEIPGSSETVTVRMSPVMLTADLQRLYGARIPTPVDEIDQIPNDAARLQREGIYYKGGL